MRHSDSSPRWYQKTATIFDIFLAAAGVAVFCGIVTISSAHHTHPFSTDVHTVSSILLGVSAAVTLACIGVGGRLWAKKYRTNRGSP